MSYNFKDFDAQFPDDAACLEFIFKALFCFNTMPRQRAGNKEAAKRIVARFLFDKPGKMAEKWDCEKFPTF